MNKILAISLIMLCSASLFGQKKHVVKNNLKSMTVYEQKLDKGLGKAMKDSEVKYDNDGNITEEIEYKDGKTDKHVKYEYDDNGKKIKETELDPSGKSSKVTEYGYNDDGKKIKETELDSSDKIIKITEYKYNGDLKVEKSVYDKNKKLKSKKTYQYETY